MTTRWTTFLSYISSRAAVMLQNRLSSDQIRHSHNCASTAANQVTVASDQNNV